MAACLRVAALEPRTAPAVFTVTSAANSGAGTFRQAVLDANAAVGADSVVFDPAAFAAPQTITLTSIIDVSGPLTITGPAARVTLGGTSSSLLNLSAPAAPTLRSAA